MTFTDSRGTHLIGRYRPIPGRAVADLVERHWTSFENCVRDADHAAELVREAMVRHERYVREREAFLEGQGIVKDPEDRRWDYI